MAATVAQLLARAQELQTCSDSPRLDTELLLAHALDRNRTWLYTWPEHPVNADQTQRFEQLFKQRQQGWPVAYLTGRQEFWSLSLKVNSSTLIPRPDTETLVEAVLDTLSAECARILDLGTGSGAIALALARERPQWRILATDRSLAALTVAQDNARELDLSNVELRQSDWFSGLQGMDFDAIVSNPPYVAPNNPHLAELSHEPHSALVARQEGLADIEAIIQGAGAHLSPGGLLALEHGADQGEAVHRLFLQHGFCEVRTRRDLGARERVSMGFKESKSAA